MTNRWRGTVYETLTFTKHVHSYSILSCIFKRYWLWLRHAQGLSDTALDHKHVAWRQGGRTHCPDWQTSEEAFTSLSLAPPEPVSESGLDTCPSLASLPPTPPFPSHFTTHPLTPIRQTCFCLAPHDSFSLLRGCPCGKGGGKMPLVGWECALSSPTVARESFLLQQNACPQSILLIPQGQLL